MKIIADLHMHSHYSRATSKNMTIENIDKYAKIKGLNLIGTGDFTHPKWIAELKQKLKEEEPGFYKYNSDIRYMLTAEISLMYKQDGKGRRIHHIIFAPNFEVVDQINDWLKSKGRVDYDGRPIFGFTSIEFVEAMMKISKDIMIVPAHALTPWFGIIGSKGGFNNLEECFGDQTKHIHAIETGLSADPSMLWRISSLDKFAFISNSDSHSYYHWKLGREANVFDIKPSYSELINAIKKKDNKKFLYTIEVDPAFGKYHWDGHRSCNVVLSPKDSIKNKNTCPVCKKLLTIGVEHRIEELADRREGFVPKNAIPFKKLLPLAEIVAALYGTSTASKKVKLISEKLIADHGSELNVLLEADVKDEKLNKVIIKNREGKIKVTPGYDGVYGKLTI